MIKEQILIFLLRWAVSSVGMWICISLFGHFTAPHDFWIFITAGLIFSLVNSTIKPIITTMALPLIILTLGIATLLINIAMVALTIWLLPGVEMDFTGVIVSMLVMWCINYLVNLSIPEYNTR